MKKIAGLVLIALLFFLSPGTALGDHWGIKAGGTLSFSGDPETSIIYIPSNRLAARGGIFLNFPIGGGFSLQPELSFSMKGVRYYNVYWRDTLTVTLNYIEIPVLLKMNFLKRVGIALGPYIGFLIKTPPLDDGPNEWTWRENRVRKIDAGISASLDYRFMKPFFVELQFCQGFANVVYSSNTDYRSFRKPFRNSTLSLLLGVIF
jgi:hypothetical protein